MDIFKLIKSKTRKKILQFFFKNTEKKYYLRELERILDLPVGNVRRELTSLEEMSLFNREKMGNQVYYSLNHSSPYFQGVESIISQGRGRSAEKHSWSGLKDKPVLLNDKKSVVIGKEDLNSLLSKINELENTIENISRNVPKNYFSYRLGVKKNRKRKTVSY